MRARVSRFPRTSVELPRRSGGGKLEQPNYARKMSLESKLFEQPRSSAPVAEQRLSLHDLLQLGLNLLQHDRNADAKTLYDSILAIDPNQPDALHFLGIVQHRQGDHQAALKTLRRSIELMPGLGWPHSNLGNVLRLMRRPGEALAAYRRCIELDPDHAEAHSNIGGLLRKQKDLAGAEAACRRAIELRPEFATPWYLLSRVLIEQGRIAEGLIASSTAIALGPRDRASRENVCRALTLLGRLDEAAVLYRQWLAEEPDNEVVRHHLAACAQAEVPARASDRYVQTVFDGFAESFDDKLERLHYRAPQWIAQRMRESLPAPTKQYRIADLGCGTGLCAPLIAPWAARLVGCDLSEAMLAKARLRGGYDALLHAELVAFLRAHRAGFDLLISADTVCYFGALEELAVAAFGALAGAGRLLFTVEALSEADGRDSLLLPHGRYSHARRYVEATMRGAGFARVDGTACELRTENGMPVRGWVIECQR